MKDLDDFVNKSIVFLERNSYKIKMRNDAGYLSDFAIFLDCRGNNHAHGHGVVRVKIKNNAQRSNSSIKNVRCHIVLPHRQCRNDRPIRINNH